MGRVVSSYNLSIREVEAGNQKFKVVLGYIVSSKPALVICLSLSLFVSKPIITCVFTTQDHTRTV